MKRKNTIILFFVALFTTIVIVFLFFVDQQKKPEFSTPIQPSPPTLVEKNTAISLFPDQPTKVHFYFKTPLSSPPASLTMYAPTYLSSAAMLEASFQIATKLGFNTDPIGVGPPEEKTWVWNNDDSSLSFQERPPVISYTGKLSLNTVGFTFDEVAKKTISFLSSLGFSLNNMILSPTSMILFEETEGGNPQDELYLLTLDLNIDGKFPIQISGVPTAVTVVVDKNGNLRSFSFPVPPKVVSDDFSEPILTLNLMLANLNNNKGSLVELKGDPGSGYLQPQPNFKEVEITGYKIVYYLNEQQTIFRPAFLIYGFGLGEKINQQVTYFLPAL